MEMTKEVSHKKWNWKVFLQSQVAVLIFSALISIVTIFFVSDFTKEFHNSAATTTGIFLSNILLIETLYVSVFVFENPVVAVGLECPLLVVAHRCRVEHCISAFVFTDSHVLCSS